MIAWPNEMARRAYATVSAVCSCVFLCVPVRREFRVLVHILRYDSYALSVSFVVFILCAVRVCTCELHARVDFSVDVSAARLLAFRYSCVSCAVIPALCLSPLWHPSCTLYVCIRARSLSRYDVCVLYLFSCAIFLCAVCAFFPCVPVFSVFLYPVL